MFINMFICSLYVFTLYYCFLCRPWHVELAEQQPPRLRSQEAKNEQLQHGLSEGCHRQDVYHQGRGALTGVKHDHFFIPGFPLWIGSDSIKRLSLKEKERYHGICMISSCKNGARGATKLMDPFLFITDNTHYTSNNTERPAKRNMKPVLSNLEFREKFNWVRSIDSFLCEYDSRHLLRPQCQVCRH